MDSNGHLLTTSDRWIPDDASDNFRHMRLGLGEPVDGEVEDDEPKRADDEEHGSPRIVFVGRARAEGPESEVK